LRGLKGRSNLTVRLLPAIHLCRTGGQASPPTPHNDKVLFHSIPSLPLDFFEKSAKIHSDKLPIINDWGVFLCQILKLVGVAGAWSVLSNQTTGVQFPARPRVPIFDKHKRKGYFVNDKADHDPPKNSSAKRMGFCNARPTSGTTSP